MRRVVITGAGTINALGTSVAETQTALAEGRCGIGPLRIKDLDRLGVRIGGQIHGFDPATRFDARELSLYDRMSQLALVAAQEAVTSAELDTAALGARGGVILGNSGGGLGTIDAAYRAVFEDGKNRVHPFTVPRLMPNAPAAHVSMRHGLRGPAFAVSSACASSNHAMAQALGLIRQGQADVVLTGGSEAMLTFGGIKAWEGLRVLSATGCRPFAADRDGMVQGEGAAVFVFEAEEHARARGARVLAHVAGAGMSADAGDIVLPEQAGAVAAIETALRDADLSGADIGYINAHGTGTRANDLTEARAIGSLFPNGVPVSSTKGAHGHLIGGTGAVELLAALMAMGGEIAGTVGCATPDPDCEVDIVTQNRRVAPVGAVLSNAFAFGGMNAVIALTAP